MSSILYASCYFDWGVLSSDVWWHSAAVAAGLAAIGNAGRQGVRAESASASSSGSWTRIASGSLSDSSNDSWTRIIVRERERQQQQQLDEDTTYSPNNSFQYHTNHIA